MPLPIRTPSCVLLVAALLALGCTPPVRVPRPAVGGTWVRVTDWPRLPTGVVFGGVTSVAVDGRGRVIVLHRAGRVFDDAGLARTDPITDAPVVELDAATGAVVGRWGENTFLIPHSITVDRSGNRWITDVARQQVIKFSPEGRQLLAVGQWHVAGTDSAHFNLPTDVVVDADGSFLVSDGYRNARVVQFDAAGRYLRQWGTTGTSAGQFRTPHGIAADGQGRVYVADRENSRVQLFDRSGRFVDQWPRVATVNQLADVAVSASGMAYVVQRLAPNAVAILDRDLVQVGRIPFDSANVVSAHSLAVDGDSVVYLAEVGARRVVKYVRR